MNDNCVVCKSELQFQWTDTHGVAICCICGAPYRILHYSNDDDKKRVNKPPECQLRPEWIIIAQRYYNETKNMVDPGGFDFGILSRHTGTYSGASEEDFKAWRTWLMDHKTEFAIQEEEIHESVSRKH